VQALMPVPPPPPMPVPSLVQATAQPAPPPQAVYEPLMCLALANSSVYFRVRFRKWNPE